MGLAFDNEWRCADSFYQQIGYAIFRKIVFTEIKYIEKLLRDLRLRVVLLIMEGSDTQYLLLCRKYGNLLSPSIGLTKAASAFSENADGTPLGESG